MTSVSAGSSGRQSGAGLAPPIRPAPSNTIPNAHAHRRIPRPPLLLLVLILDERRPTLSSLLRREWQGRPEGASISVLETIFCLTRPFPHDPAAYLVPRNGAPP